MQTIFEAKKHFAARHLSEEGFVGVGIGQPENTDALRVYVETEDCAIAQQFKNEPTYEGFPVIVKVTGKARATRIIHKHNLRCDGYTISN